MRYCNEKGHSIFLQTSLCSFFEILRQLEYFSKLPYARSSKYYVNLNFAHSSCISLSFIENTALRHGSIFRNDGGLFAWIPNLVLVSIDRIGNAISHGTCHGVPIYFTISGHIVGDGIEFAAQNVGTRIYCSLLCKGRIVGFIIRCSIGAIGVFACGQGRGRCLRRRIDGQGSEGTLGTIDIARCCGSAWNRRRVSTLNILILVLLKGQIAVVQILRRG